MNENNNNGSNKKNIEKKVGDLKKLADLVKNNGNLILAACYIGRGTSGRDMGESINYLTGCRLNTFLPTGFVAAGAGNDPKTGLIPWMDDTFKVDTTPGWLKISPQGTASHVNEIKINIGSNGNPVSFPPKKIIKK